jgi:F-type H+-transporting ATPase subunit a
MDSVHVALSAEKITEWWGIPITNTLITSWIVMSVLFFIAFFVGKNIQMIPGKLQAFFEMVFGGILDYMAETLDSRKLALRFFPLIATLFIFIFLANIMEFIPGVGSIGFEAVSHGEHIFTPLFRSVNTDLNMTLALTIIAFFTIEFSGIFILGFLKYSSKFVNFNSPLDFAIGIIELFSELVRLVSFSFRLFGNIFAGEVLILVITFLVPYVVPVPFIFFELFVGLVQAAIFSLLTLFYIKLAVTEPH